MNKGSEAFEIESVSWSNSKILKISNVFSENYIQQLNEVYSITLMTSCIHGEGTCLDVTTETLNEQIAVVNLQEGLILHYLSCIESISEFG